MTLPTPRRRPQSVTAAAVEDIKRYIREQHLRTGDPLPTESEICERLGYSRSSVREAIRILSTLDIVTVRHGHGTYVSGMSLEPLVNGLVFRTVLEADDSLGFLGNVVDAREALDLSLGAELARSVDGETVEQLNALVEKMRERIAHGEHFAEEDQAFHRLLVSRTANPLVRELSDAFWQVHDEVMPLLHMDVVSVADRQRSVEAHQAIVDAVEKGETEAYTAAVREHYAPLRSVIEARV
ncbi:FadR/GntR family transcriptional regulator [Corynebacterium tapiri]|uniref:FadR family transcriptional regulator n=1 Tax=Corynebacterium tapiri TaxID=1448266 RepID=A0A5C4U339_9CORY|nr:FadR/GntR family transcriptional regulator [Corynebacterium tapiri]TNL96071.1 FadR family transcriptional regulator [Corynebacterium tapiri]